jgi:hypothetical protein
MAARNGAPNRYVQEAAAAGLEVEVDEESLRELESLDREESPVDEPSEPDEDAADAPSDPALAFDPVGRLSVL